MSELNYAVAVSGLEPIQAPPTPDGQAAHWSPLSHTLIYGPTAAVVVDPPITKQQSATLADWIEARGTSLEYIYVTHWHGDHWFGTPELLRRFPGATVLASAATIERMRASVEGGAVQGLWTNLFGDRIPDGAALAAAASRADAVPADGFEIDGHRLYSAVPGSGQPLHHLAQCSAIGARQRVGTEPAGSRILLPQTGQEPAGFRPRRAAIA